MTHATIRSYAIGFGLSLALTFLAFFAAGALPREAPVIILALAVAQLMVQMFFFLHLGRDRDSSGFLFALTAIIIAIVVVGTLWIMANLARFHHQVTPADLYEGGIVSPERDLH